MNPFLPNYKNIGGKKLINIQQRNHILAILNIKPSLQIPNKQKRCSSSKIRPKQPIIVNNKFRPVFPKEKQETNPKRSSIDIKQYISKNVFVSDQRDENVEAFNAILEDQANLEEDEPKIQTKNLNNFLNNLKEYASRFGEELPTESKNLQKSKKMDHNYISQPYKPYGIRPIASPNFSSQKSLCLNVNRNGLGKVKKLDSPFLYRFIPQSAKGLKTSALTREFEIKAMMNNLAEIERKAIKTQSFMRKDFKKQAGKKKCKIFFVSEYNQVRKNEEDKLKIKQKVKLERRRTSKSKKRIKENLDLGTQEYQTSSTRKNYEDLRLGNNE